MHAHVRVDTVQSKSLLSSLSTSTYSRWLNVMGLAPCTCSIHYILVYSSVVTLSVVGASNSNSTQLQYIRASDVYYPSPSPTTTTTKPNYISLTLLNSYSLDSFTRCLHLLSTSHQAIHRFTWCITCPSLYFNSLY